MVVSTSPRVTGLLWMYQMHVLGHDDPAVQVEVEPSASVPEIEKELVADALVVQEREALVK